MNTTALRLYKATLRMSARQEQILVGMLLGDGHLERQKGARLARLKVEHSISQLAYVNWKYEEWRSWVRTPPASRARRARGGVVSTNVGFTSLSHEQLEESRLRFYVGRRKVVPTDLKLTPLSVAVWFMDDGSRKSSQCRGLYLNTQSFTLEEVQRLQKVMLRDIGVETTLRQQRDGLQIYVPSRSSAIFTEFMAKEMLSCMAYKLPG